MKSPVIVVGNDESLVEKAIEVSEEFIYGLGLDGKAALHLNLLAEEVLGMVRAMVGDFSARFWMEAESGECKIQVDALADVDKAKKRKLMEVSSTGKNIANKGIMAKIGGFFSDCMDNYDDAMAYDGQGDAYGYMIASGMSTHAMMSMGANMWSLSNYRSSVMVDKKSKKEAEEAWDELEKSIVANIADDVMVGVKDNHVILTVVKKM